MKSKQLKLKQYSSIGLAFVAAAGLLFAGCAKKTTVEESTPVSAESGEATTQGVSTAQEPSSHTVYFAFDSSELDAAARGILDANAAWLKTHTVSSITIEGNCDERGSREYNLALGQRRADSVRDYLASQGIPADGIGTVSFGEERPVCQGTGEACWAQNRHADIVAR
ncbi:MAG: peptidoglycan-associated lipoprotein Pal [Zetaproteobacteria bacterium]|nr:MAG: peptidoglycan-associated lipoprotein Pal [Zetaproteobacteria bacterium]